MEAFSKSNPEAFANFLRAKYDAYTGATTASAYPYYLIIEPSDVCQLRCPTCATGRENENRKQGGIETAARESRYVMKPELFDALLEEMGQYLFMIMFYNWGEPLLNKALPDFVSKAHSQGIQTEVHSNLSLPIDQGRAEALLAAGLDTLVGSIDGFSQESYQVHRVGGDLALVKKNLELLAATRDRLGLNTRIIYKMLVFKHNEHELKAAKRYCQKLGIQFSSDEAGIYDERWLPSHRAGEKPHIPKRIVEDPTQWEWAEEYFGSLEKESFYAPYRDNDDEDTPNYCSWHYGVSLVTGGGPVSPCCGTAKDRDDFGAVVPGKTSFAEVWNNEHFRHARGVLSGDIPAGTTEPDTLCDHCFFPRIVQHVYSIHDMQIIAAFHRHIGKEKPALEAGFRIMSRIRYGAFISALLRRKWFHPIMMLGTSSKSEIDMSAFTQFYKEHLLTDTSFLPEVDPLKLKIVN